MSDEKNIGYQKKTEEEIESIDEKDLARKFGHIEKRDTQKTTGSSQEEIGNVENGKVVNEVATAEKDSAYQRILSKAKQKSGVKKNNKKEIISDAEKTSLQQDAESRIQNLVDLAKEKGVIHSVKVARLLDNNYVLDCLHDKLLEEKLLEDGLI